MPESFAKIVRTRRSLTPVKTARAKIPPQAITVKINYSAFFEVRRCNYFKEEPVNMAINLEMLQEKAKDVRIDIIRQIPRAPVTPAALFPRRTSSLICILRR